MVAATAAANRWHRSSGARGCCVVPAKKIVKLRCVIFIRSIILLVVHGGVEQDNCFLNRHCGIDLPGRQLGDSVTKLRVRLGQSRNHGWPVKTAAAARSHFVDVRGKVENDL